MTSRTNKGKTYECYVRNCNAKFATQGQRIIHINEKHEGKVFCPYENCESLLKTSYIRLHIRWQHEKDAVKIKCHNCGKLISKKYISQHLERCTSDGSRNFQCQIDGCQASFTVKAALNNHVSNVYCARIKCPFKDCVSFVKPLNLVKHLKTIHEKVKKQCKKCGKSVSYNNFNVHVQGCHSDGEKKFKCEQEGCPAKFTTVAQRSHHVRKVHRPR